MLVAYLIIIGIGTMLFLAWFMLILKKERSLDAVSLTKDIADDSSVEEQAVEMPSKAEVSRPRFFIPFIGKLKIKKAELPKTEAAQRSQVPVVEISSEASRNAKPDEMNKPDQKYIKLEQLLEEKNQSLALLQKDLLIERGHQGEYESLKAIFQQQIDELKTQNRGLKDELERTRQENFRLQAGMKMPPAGVSAPKNPVSADLEKSSLKPAAQPDFIRAEPDDEVIPSHREPESSAGSPSEDSDGGVSGGPLTLKDVFGAEPEPK